MCVVDALNEKKIYSSLLWWHSFSSLSLTHFFFSLAGCRLSRVINTARGVECLVVRYCVGGGDRCYYTTNLFVCVFVRAYILACVVLCVAAATVWFQPSYDCYCNTSIYCPSVPLCMYSLCLHAHTTIDRHRQFSPVRVFFFFLLLFIWRGPFICSE